jgi:hypothetical protein
MLRGLGSHLCLQHCFNQSIKEASNLLMQKVTLPVMPFNASFCYSASFQILLCSFDLGIVLVEGIKTMTHYGKLPIKAYGAASLEA